MRFITSVFTPNNTACSIRIYRSFLEFIFIYRSNNQFIRYHHRYRIIIPYTFIMIAFIWIRNDINCSVFIKIIMTIAYIFACVINCSYTMTWEWIAIFNLNLYFNCFLFITIDGRIVRIPFSSSSDSSITVSSSTVIKSLIS